MSKPNHVYAVNAYRFGDREAHSYLVGVYTTKTKAMNAATKEEANRGHNKYQCEVEEVELDRFWQPGEPIKQKTIKPLTGWNEDGEFKKVSA